MTDQELRDAKHYERLMLLHLADSRLYQAHLFHSWKCIREQAKGLRRQAAKIKRLKQKLSEVKK